MAGVVTAVRGNGFYLQDPHPDVNPNTSEAIFVFTSAAPTVLVGHSVRVSGIVSEFQPGGSSTGNLTTTQIGSPTITVVSAGNPLPAATSVGQGGRSAPTEVIDDDGLTSFQPVSEGIDFYESLEGMRLQVPQAVATGPTSSFGEISILPDAGLGAGLRTSRGGIIVRPDDFNPERTLLDHALVPLPLVDTGASLGTVQGVLDYSFGNFKLLCTVAPTATGGVTRETTLLQNAVDALTVAAFNCENLDPSDDAAKFAALAAAVVQRLQSPDILTIEEI